MTQEFVCEAVMAVAKKRGHSAITACKLLKMKPAEYQKYKSGRLALHFDTFFSWCHALRVSPHSIIARAQIAYEEETKIVLQTRFGQEKGDVVKKEEE